MSSGLSSLTTAVDGQFPARWQPPTSSSCISPLPEGFPWHWEKLPSCKREQPRNTYIVEGGDNARRGIPQPTEDGSWPQTFCPWIGDSETCSSRFLKSPRRTEFQLPQLGGIKEHFVVFLRLTLPLGSLSPTSSSMLPGITSQTWPPYNASRVWFVGTPTNTVLIYFSSDIFTNTQITHKINERLTHIPFINLINFKMSWG